ncbi:MAG: 5,10-methylenetetrahydrofolate reductase, partial [Nitrospiraceae bacterium]
MSSQPRRLKEVLDRSVFAVTVEYNPPKGTTVDKLLASARSLLGRVHAVNVTDNTAAVMRAGSLSVCRLLYEM